MAITLPSCSGGVRTLDEPGGEVIYDSFDGAVDVRKNWSLEAVMGGALTAVGPGSRYDSTDGLRLYDNSGAVTIHLSAVDGSLTITGQADIGGETIIRDDTEILGTLVVHADTTVDGTLTVQAGGEDVLVADGTGLTIRGKLEAGGLTIEDDEIEFEDGTYLRYSASDGGFSIVSPAEVYLYAGLRAKEGAFVENGLGAETITADDVAAQTLQVSLGWHLDGGTPQAKGTITGQRGSGNTANRLNDLLNYLQARGILTNGTTT